MGTQSPSFLRRTLAKITSSDEEVQAAQLREDALQCGATPVVECARRGRVNVSGTLRSVTLQPRGGVPALEAELYDGTGIVTIIWLGRRRIPGIEAGRGITACGLVSVEQGRRVLFNPRYELHSAAGE